MKHLLVSPMLVFGLVACGSGNSGSGAPSISSPSEEVKSLANTLGGDTSLKDDEDDISSINGRSGLKKPKKIKKVRGGVEVEDEIDVLYFVGTQTRYLYNGSEFRYHAPYPATTEYLIATEEEYLAAKADVAETVVTEEVVTGEDEVQYKLHRVIYQDVSLVYSGFYNMSQLFGGIEGGIGITSVGCDLFQKTGMTIRTENAYGHALFLNNLGKMQCEKVELSCAELNAYRVDSDKFFIPKFSDDVVRNEITAMTCP